MAETILSLFRRNALRLGETPCLHYKEANQWKSLSWVDTEELVRRYALGLSGLGLRAGDRVGLWSKTRMEWTLLDLAILANQSITVPIYHTLISEQAAYILQDAKVSMLILEEPSQWEKIKPYLKDWKGPVILLQGEGAGFVSLQQLKEKAKGLPVNLYDENLRQLKPLTTATYIYTSGTTGQPKGVLLTHRNILAEVQSLQEVFQFNADSVGFMILPLAHVVARAMQFYQLAEGCQSAYVENLDMVGINLLEVRPHFMAVVPRLLEKMNEKILATVQKSSKTVQNLFNWSLKVGREVSELKQKKLRVPHHLKFRYFLATALVFRKIRKGLGGRLQCLISGGAPLSKESAQFLHAIGISVLEGYGLTETFAAITLNRPDDFRFGTVGKPLEGVRIKIAGDGEVCVKGDTVFVGYYNLKKETEEAFDPEGWFLTGDIGEFTKDGFLRITDRKKDMIKTSGGKYIAPQSIESLMQQSHYIQQIMVYGDGKKYLTALVTLNWDVVEDYARQNHLEYHSRKDLAHHPKIIQLVRKEIDEKNGHLSSFETIKKFAILSSNFSIESGELTPTLKVKRKEVTKKYRDILDQLYNNEIQEIRGP